MDTKALDPASGAQIYRTLTQASDGKRTRKGSFWFQGGGKNFLAVEPWPPVEAAAAWTAPTPDQIGKDDAARCLRNLGRLGALPHKIEEAEAAL